jgi:predicted TPR repeat methyltransferase
MADDLDAGRARELFREGVRHSAGQDFDGARRAFEASLALQPERAATRVRLAATLLQLGADDQALALLDEVLGRDPRHLDALGLRGAVLAGQGRFDEALQAFDRSLAVKAGQPQAWALRARVLGELGRSEEADESRRRAAEVEPREPQVEQYFEAAAAQSTPPPTAPRAYVRSLFDNYAANFDTELVDTLDYRAPRWLAQALAKLDRRFANALDLGCGTGLCGPVMKPWCDRLEGVDLSPAMLERARVREGVYDALHLGDIVEFLASATGPYQLVVAADVFIYVGALEPVFEQLARVLPAGGVFWFSVEAHGGPENFVLRTSRRYAHAGPYVLDLAQRHGFDVAQSMEAPIRDQGSEPVEGLCFTLVRRAAAPAVQPSAMNASSAQVQQLFAQGVKHYQAGQFEDAERSFEAARALAPGRAATLTTLGATRLKLGRLDEALAVLDEAIAIDPANIDSLGLRATALADLGLHQDALAAFDRVLAVNDKAAQVWTLRGSVLVELGRFDEAAASYEKALAHGGDPQINHYYLAAAAGRKPPATAPREYVEVLFDKYSDNFDSHLVHQLKYQAPKVLAEQLARSGRKFAHVLDLGCGTGLCGRIAKAIMLHIEGVDLSARMLEKAAESEVYEKLVQADIVEFLRTATGPYDLVISADVFIYVGALDEVFDHVARTLQSDGVFCFSVEEASAQEGLVLRPSRRYAHSEPYVRELAARHGFEVQQMQRDAIRDSKEGPIPGLYFWLARSA